MRAECDIVSGTAPSGLILARRTGDEPCQDGNVAAISLYLRVLQVRRPDLPGNRGAVFSCARRASDPMTHPEPEPYYEPIHADAIRRGEHSYIDPKTGFLVFTELFLLERGYCCRAGCRHCPYGYNA